MKFEEIIPACDRISDELDKILGGSASTGVVCGTGAICEVGEYVPDKPQPEPDETDPSNPKET